MEALKPEIPIEYFLLKLSRTNGETPMFKAFTKPLVSGLLACTLVTYFGSCDSFRIVVLFEHKIALPA